MDKKKRTKSLTFVAVAVVAAAALMTGTYAWWSISQRQVNKKVVEFNEGARLHDDWNGTTKSVYVENYLDETEDAAGPVFVRVRFMEYMEFGSEAGNRTNLTRDVKKLVETSDCEDSSTWPIHKVNDPDDPFHQYMTWTMGDESGAGKTVYMPTFNKNKESLAADVNGTYAGKNGVHFADHETYTVGQQVTDDAYYYADSSAGTPHIVSIQDAAGNVIPGTETGSYLIGSETHTAKETLTTTQIISIKEWKDLSAAQKIGSYWVYDTDGWFYWAAPLEPQTATGLLISRVDASQSIEDKCYYAVDSMCECASAEDWGMLSDPDESGNATGFYENGITDEALELLDTLVQIPYN